jgi:hypothetical protein
MSAFVPASEAPSYESIDQKVIETLASRRWLAFRFPNATRVEQLAAQFRERGLLVLQYSAFILIMSGPNMGRHIDALMQPAEVWISWDDDDPKSALYGPIEADDLFACVEGAMRRENLLKPEGQKLPARSDSFYPGGAA